MSTAVTCWYVRNGQLFGAVFDRTRLELAGPATPVVKDVAYAMTSGTAQFSVSDTGLLAYRRARNPQRVLQWMNFAGQFESIRTVPAEYQEMRFSPDGTRALLVIGRRGAIGHLGLRPRQRSYVEGNVSP